MSRSKAIPQNLRSSFLSSLTMASILLGFAAASLASLVSTAATSGDFNVLSFNVAGLPALLNDNAVPGDKATNAGTIGTLFTEYDYDVINVQEGEFNFSWVTGPKLIEPSRLRISCLYICNG